MWNQKTVNFSVLMGIFAALNLVAQSKMVDSQIVQVHLFKNGKAMVTETFASDGAGTYLLANLPAPSHGSFWVEKGEVAAIRVVDHWVENLETPQSALALGPHLEGHWVSLTLNKDREVQGRIVAGPWTQGSTGLWILDTIDQRIMVRYQDVELVSFPKNQNDDTSRPQVQKNLLAFDLTGHTSDEVRFSYLTNGIGWAPSYRLDLVSDTSLEIRQKALIRNELREMKNVKVLLVSGYPHLEFGHVLAPMGKDFAWAKFFNSLEGQLAASGSSFLNVSSQVRTQGLYSSHGGSEADASANYTPGSQDMFFQEAGTMDLAKGEVVFHETAKTRADYKKQVVCDLKNHRDERGSVIRAQEKDPEEDAWEELIFKNPFDFPMTTAPAMVFRDTRIVGQTKSTWANPGATHRLRVTRALSVEVDGEEWVLDGDRKSIQLFGYRYEENQIQGRVEVHNTRNTEIEIRISKSFFGELITSEGNPQHKILRANVDQVNKGNELIWTQTIKPGEAKTLTYTYKLLVRR